jgi:hypothetical protein
VTGKEIELVKESVRDAIDAVIEHIATLLEQERGDRHETAARAKRIRSLKSAPDAEQIGWMRIGR